MKSDRAITTTATLLLLAMTAAAPATATANTLLSGYGGPGEGSQAILGSALLNAPAGGGQGGGGPAGAGGSSGSGGQPPGLAAGHSAPAAASGHGSRAAGNARQSTGPASKALENGSRQYGGASTSAASRTAVGGSQALGLSGADLVYMLLGLGALALTGAFTRQLAKPARTGRDAR